MLKTGVQWAGKDLNCNEYLIYVKRKIIEVGIVYAV
jgi:hypothetical protein